MSITLFTKQGLAQILLQRPFSKWQIIGVGAVYVLKLGIYAGLLIVGIKFWDINPLGVVAGAILLLIFLVISACANLFSKRSSNEARF